MGISPPISSFSISNAQTRLTPSIPGLDFHSLHLNIFLAVVTDGEVVFLLLTKMHPQLIPTLL